MDKYEDAMTDLKNEGGCLLLEKETIPVLEEALEKARKFDQLVEARKKATPGEWETWWTNGGSLKCDEMRTPEDLMFAVTAANLTREDTK